MAKELLSEGAQTALAQVEAALSGRAQTLDLALVRSALAGAQEQLALGAEVTTDLATLREDLSGRVRGMQSALAVATDSSDPRSADTREELLALSAADLIKRYRITCARFRDTFPGRFTYLGPGDTTRKKHDWTDYQS